LWPALRTALRRRAGDLIILRDLAALNLGRRTFAQIVPIEQVTTVVTDNQADQSECTALRERGTDVIIA
jgi:DeoR/GlpR family transcriptional regulator of sugar metabolism